MLPTIHNKCLSFLSHNPSYLSFDHLKQIHSISITSSLLLPTSFITKLLHFISIHGFNDPPYLSFLLDRIPETTTPPLDAFSWNTWIKGLSFSSQPEFSLLLFSKMRNQDVIPDSYTYSLLLKSFSRSKTENPNQIHAQVMKFGLSSDSFVQNSLVSAYSSLGLLEFAYKVFDEISHRDLVSWTAMIDGYVKNNQPKMGLDCFMEMRSMGVRIDGVSIVSVLSAVGMLGELWFGRWVHGFYIESGRVQWDMYVGAALLSMYARCGSIDEARMAFDEMPVRNVVSWSALIAGYLQSARLKEALDVFQDMLLDQVEPNQTTLSSVLTACAQLGALDQGRWVRNYIDKNSLRVNSILGTALIDMYSKCGSLEEAFLAFQKLPQKDIYPWTAMINGFAMHGHSLNSMKLFARMLIHGVRPNQVTFLGILCACSHGGMIDKGYMFFSSMTRIYGVERKVDHYGCMVDLLGRAGYLDKALNLINSMPMEPSPGVWGALFGACMIHKDFELGEQIGKHLIELQPNRSGRYMLLANIYCESGKWDEAARVRKLMKEKRVEKITGCSFIEVNGSIHEFIAWDKSHSESKDIYVMLEGIPSHLKFAGYVPPTDSNLMPFDMEMGSSLWDCDCQ